MRIVVSSQGEELEAQASQVFGRCPTYLFVDSETMAFEALSNPAMNQGGGAGIQAAQFVVSQGAEAVLSGNLGPNAYDVLQAAEVPGYLIPEGTVRHAVEAFNAGRLESMAGASVAAHAGRRGMGMGRGGPSSTPDAQRAAELAELHETLKSLRQQLAETMEKIERLERE
jgi:predicted Fe-Mo cluster-binding NifX family protein